MRSSLHALLPIFILAAVTLLTVVQTLPPPPLLVDAPAAEFSAVRAIAHLQVLAQAPRPTGSAANAAARAYILDVLKGLGLETETQPDGNLVNVLGRLAGTRSSGAVLLTAHLDSVADAPGATDDGSGVAVLLETARRLASGGPLRNTVMFLFTDFEEGGLVGAQAFIARHPWARDVKVVIGFDAGGLSGPGVLSATSPANGWLIRQLAQADPYLVGSSAINALADSGTDFGHAFKPAGFPGYAFDLYWDRRIHTPADNLQNLSPSSLQHQGYHALSLARHFGNLNALADPREPDAVYFTVLRLFTVTYPSAWAAPLAIAAAVAFIGVVASGLRRQILTWRGMGYGAFTALVGIIIAPTPAILLGSWVPGVPFRFASRALDRPPQVGLVVLSTLVLIVFWYFLSRRLRCMPLADLILGTLALMFAGMAGTAIAFPALSFAFIWPLLLSLLACANWFYWIARNKSTITVGLSLLLSGAASIIIIGPTILLGLFDQMSLTLPLLGLLCGYLVPLIHQLAKNEII